MRLMDDRGYAMAALLVALSVMGIMLGVALPVWQTLMQREREAELVFRGEQYVHAIDLFSRRTGGFPTSLEALRTGRYIRRLYKDPITGGDFRPVFLGQISTPGVPQPGQRTGGPGAAQTGRAAAAAGAGGRAAQAPPEAGVPGRAAGAGPGQIAAGAAGPIIGVVSTSTAEALRLYNGRGRYNEWLFVATAATQQPGAPPGSGTPGARGGGPPPAGRRGFPGPGTPPPSIPPPPSRGAPLPGMPMRGVGPMR